MRSGDRNTKPPMPQPSISSSSDVPINDCAAASALERRPRMSENISTHSADVEMWLDCGPHGKSRLSRSTPNPVVLSQSFDAPPCEADLIVYVDNKRMARRVKLIRGISKNR